MRRVPKAPALRAAGRALANSQTMSKRGVSRAWNKRNRRKQKASKDKALYLKGVGKVHYTPKGGVYSYAESYVRTQSYVCLSNLLIQWDKINKTSLKDLDLLRRIKSIYYDAVYCARKFDRLVPAAAKLLWTLCSIIRDVTKSGFGDKCLKAHFYPHQINPLRWRTLRNCSL